MEKIDFNNKTFLLVENSDEGTVNPDTVFDYQQEGNLVSADYHGGPIRYGKIIAKLEGDRLDMLYQCLTQEGELKAGKAVAKVSRDEVGRLQLSLDWEWISGREGHGTSEYIERIDG